MGNHPEGIYLTGNCLGLIGCGVIILGGPYEVDNCLGSICMGAISFPNYNIGHFNQLLIPNFNL